MRSLRHAALFALCLSACGAEDAASSLTGDAAPPSGDAAPPSGDATPPPPGGATQVGLAAQSFSVEGLTDKKAIFDVFVGEHPVAVYAAYEQNLGRLGAGTLEVAREGSVARMTLKDAAGAVLVSASNDFDASMSGQVELSNFDRNYRGDVTVANGFDFIDVRFGIGDPFPLGMLAGRTGIEASWVPDAAARVFYFRNNVVHAGAQVPEAFAALAGTYTSASPAATVTITAGGEVTIDGTNPFSGVGQSLTLSWDGIDDIIAPNMRSVNGVAENAPDELRIELNANNGYGSFQQGGISLVIPSLEVIASTPALLSARLAMPGGGGFEVTAPVRTP